MLCDFSVGPEKQRFGGLERLIGAAWDQNIAKEVVCSDHVGGGEGVPLELP